MPTSIPLILAVFLLGFVSGALLVAIERRARIEKIRQGFQEQLEAIIERASMDDNAGEARQSASKAPEAARSDPSRAA